MSKLIHTFVKIKHMKILEVSRIEYFFVTTDEKDYNTYRRSVNGNSDCWELLMGESWESYYSAYELEELFQEWLSCNELPNG